MISGWVLISNPDEWRLPLMRVRKHYLCLLILAIFLIGAPRLVYAPKVNVYMAGYVIAYNEQPAAKAADPTLDFARYAAEKRDMLKERGPVPNRFWRGLKDGFRDCQRGRSPKHTMADLDLNALPPHLRP
jgi:hypothetical protein